MNAIEFHDAIATQFDRRYESSRAFGERVHVWTALFDRYIRPDDRVTDLGCGSGIFCRYLAGKGCQVTGIDGSMAMIRLCDQKKDTDAVRFVVQSLPFPDPAVYAGQDAVIASSLLEYVDDMGLALRQIHAMLNVNGLLIVSIPNRISLYRRIERLVFATTGYPRYFAYLRNVSTETNFNRQLATLGFDVVETGFFSSHDPVSRWLKWILPRPYVNNLLVGVYRKR